MISSRPNLDPSFVLQSLPLPPFLCTAKHRTTTLRDSNAVEAVVVPVDDGTQAERLHTARFLRATRDAIIVMFVYRRLVMMCCAGCRSYPSVRRLYRRTAGVRIFDVSGYGRSNAGFGRDSHGRLAAYRMAGNHFRVLSVASGMFRTRAKMRTQNGHHSHIHFGMPFQTEIYNISLK